MNREAMLQKIEATIEWDIIIIGGGATGLGAAVDAASRGYKTLLLEQADFGKGTSSRSTKLLHGGVRYLAQGNIKLVMEALKERGRLLKNAPHITSVQPFVLPIYSYWKKWYYAIGLKLYDLLSGKWSLGKTELLSKKQTAALLPDIYSDDLVGGIRYYDGQFDDSRLCIDLAATGHKYEACIINYCKVIELQKVKQKISGIVFQDVISERKYTVKTKSVINATGIFTDSILQLDDKESHHLVSPSQGIHVVIDKIFFKGNDALIIPKTADGRVLFAVPWHGKVVVGTTDTPINEITAEPKPLEEEIDFIFEHFNLYCTTQLKRTDVKSVFAGLRPLVNNNSSANTASLSRDHTIVVSNSGLVTITGGKWTTYRKMAEDAVNNASFSAKLPSKKCSTYSLPIGNWQLPINNQDSLKNYGKHAEIIKEWSAKNPDLQTLVHPSFPQTKAEVIWMIRNEMAITVEDILARRMRLLFLDAQAALDSTERIADWMMTELGKDELWKQNQIKLFTTLAQQYLLH